MKNVSFLSFLSPLRLSSFYFFFWGLGLNLSSTLGAATALDGASSVFSVNVFVAFSAAAACF
jgi:hypothetical protein